MTNFEDLFDKIHKILKVSYQQESYQQSKIKTIFDFSTIKKSTKYQNTNLPFFQNYVHLHLPENVLSTFHRDDVNMVVDSAVAKIIQSERIFFLKRFDDFVNKNKLSIQSSDVNKIHKTIEMFRGITNILMPWSEKSKNYWEQFRDLRLLSLSHKEDWSEYFKVNGANIRLDKILKHKTDRLYAINRKKIKMYWKPQNMSKLPKGYTKLEGGNYPNSPIMFYLKKSLKADLGVNLLIRTVFSEPEFLKDSFCVFDLV